MARDIKQLHPRLQTKVEELKALCAKEGLAIGIGECFRSVAEQDALYAQGRTTAGNIVTNAKGSSYSSQHQWGIAVDFFKNVKGHEYDDAAFFSRVGALAKSIGLGWGGDWTGFVDRPHLYLPDWGSTASKLKEQYGTFENFKKTWTQSSETPKQEAAQPSTYTGNSIVEYLNSVGKPSDFASRTQYAAQYGISNYKGTAEQNLKLLALMRGDSSAPETQPTAPAPKPTKSLEDWAEEVRAGKHGTGHENRKASLKKAGCTYDYEKVRAKVNELCGVKTSTKPASIYYPKYTGNSYGIDTVFAAIGIPEAFLGKPKNRKSIAEKNGVKNYKGTQDQNLYLIGLAKQGKLKKV